MPSARPTAPLVVRPVLSGADWAAARAVRQRVFVEEQACPPEEEWDEWDTPQARGLAGRPATAHHVLGLVGGEPVATARWRVVTYDGADYAKLERFAVLPARRGGGRGRALVAAVLADARAAGHGRFVLHAQAHLRGLYEGFGFGVVGEEFWEAGIAHLKMSLIDPGAGGAV